MAKPERRTASSGRSATSCTGAPPARSTIERRPPTRCATKARRPSSSTSTPRGSRGRSTRRSVASEAASRTASACPHPLVTTMRAPSGVAARPQGSAAVASSQITSSGASARSAGSSRTTRLSRRSVAATRPSASTRSCAGGPGSGVTASSARGPHVERVDGVVVLVGRVRERGRAEPGQHHRAPLPPVPDAPRPGPRPAPRAARPRRGPRRRPRPRHLGRHRRLCRDGSRRRGARALRRDIGRGPAAARERHRRP